MLVAAWRMLRDGTLYKDLGAGHFENRAKPGQMERRTAGITNFGYKVETAPVPA